MGHPQPVDAALSLTILWIYLIFLAIAAVGYGIVRWWRNRHAAPSKVGTEQSYAQRLSHRMNKQRADAKKKTPRKAHDDKQT